MELSELHVFLTVAAERSFSRAAAKLHRTQPAVSQAIRRLEQHLRFLQEPLPIEGITGESRGQSRGTHVGGDSNHQKLRTQGA